MHPSESIVSALIPQVKLSSAAVIDCLNGFTQTVETKQLELERLSGGLPRLLFLCCKDFRGARSLAMEASLFDLDP